MPKSINIDNFRYVTNEGWRALIGVCLLYLYKLQVEMGMKNHEVVPLELALKISRGRRGSSSFLQLFRDQLLPNGLLAFDTDSRHFYQGYRLTNMGYDYLALHQFFKSEQLSSLGSMIGAGKESDVYIAIAGSNCGRLIEDTDVIPEEKLPNLGDIVIVKFHRLGRTSFRKVKEKRDYHQHRNKCSWLYLDRLASQREFTMMQVCSFCIFIFKALFKHGVSVPIPLSHNRNAVVMSCVEDAVPLYRILPEVLRRNKAQLAKKLYAQAKHLLVTIVSVGLIHGDFNEFNLMVSHVNAQPSDAADNSFSNAKLVLIDFPQMISRDHKIADEIYLRDLYGMNAFFSRYYDIPTADLLSESLDDIKRTNYLDVLHKAPGYIGSKENRKSRKELKDSLIGSVSRLRMNSRGSEQDDSVSDQSSCDTDDNSDDDASCDEESQSESGSENDETNLAKRSPEKSSSVGGNSIKDKTKNRSSGPRSTSEIREIRRRENRQRSQADFNRRLKRHNRAKTKQKAHKEMNSELILFT